MQCHLCHTELPQEATHCPACQAPVEITPSEQFGNSFEANSYQESGAPSSPSLPLYPTSYGPAIKPPASISEISGTFSPSTPSEAQTPFSAPLETPPPLPFLVSPPILDQPKKTSRILILALAALALVVIVGGCGVLSFTVLRMARDGRAKTSITVKAMTSTPHPEDPMKLYAHVMTIPPTISDPLAGVGPNGWLNFDDAHGGCHYKDDSYHISVVKEQWEIFCYGSNDYTNFAFQTEVRLLRGASGGLLFRYAAYSDDIGYYAFQVTPNGQYSVEDASSGRNIYLKAPTPSSHIKTGYGQRNVLTVIAQGSRFYFYANGAYLTSIIDKDYTTGRVGMIVGEDVDPAETSFTNAKIWTL